VLAGCGLDAKDEGGGGEGSTQGEGLAGGGGYVVGCFGEKEGFCTCGGCLLDELLALGEIVLERGGGAELADCLDHVRKLVE
jgi:hypothetical protein